jgi:hypothetical protein
MSLFSLGMALRGALAAVAVFATAVSAPNVAAAVEPSGFPPETLAPNQEAIEFFAVIEDLLRRGEPLPDYSSEIARAFEPVMAEMLIRGERDPNWTTRGVDIHEVVAALAGGAGANSLSMQEEFGPAQVLLLDAPIDSVVPRGWALVGSFGELRSADIVHTEFSRISPKLMLAERVAYRRQGNALCRSRAQTRLYADPAVRASEADTIAYFAVRHLASRAELNRICSVFVERGPGIYQDEAFDEDGYRLPRLDADQPYSIVPRGDSLREATSD